MRQVKISIHHIKEPPSALSLDLDALHRLYWTAGIDLLLTEGSEIPVDPDFVFSYPWYLSLYKKQTTDCGHLIVARRPPDDEWEVAGRLWDLEKRGMAAVYTESSYIARSGSRGLLQTAAHEIGHMLNLGHAHVTQAFVSTMNQADERDSDVASAWADAESEANVKRLAGDATYYFGLNQATECYPFSYEARFNLNTVSDIRLLPWGGVFEHRDEVNDGRCQVGVR